MARRKRRTRHLRNPTVRTSLTPEEIEKAAQKEWKKPPIFTTDETLFKRMRHLRGPKTVEGKKRALANLRPIRGKYRLRGGARMSHGGYVERILDKEEQAFYQERREKYIKDYDLNESADEAILRMALMEEVIFFRLMKRKAEKPTLNIDRPLTECQRRLIKALKALGATREQRQGIKINLQHSIADLVASVDAKLKQAEVKAHEIDSEIQAREKARTDRLEDDDTTIERVQEYVKQVVKQYTADEDEVMDDTESVDEIDELDEK